MSREDQTSRFCESSPPAQRAAQTQLSPELAERLRWREVQESPEFVGRELMGRRLLGETPLSAAEIIKIMSLARRAEPEQPHDLHDEQFNAGAAAATALRGGSVPGPYAIAGMFASPWVPMCQDAQFAAQFAEGERVAREILKKCSVGESR